LPAVMPKPEVTIGKTGRPAWHQGMRGDRAERNERSLTL